MYVRNWQMSPRLNLRFHLNILSGDACADVENTTFTRVSPSHVHEVRAKTRENTVSPPPACMSSLSAADLTWLVPRTGDPHMTGFRGQKFDFTGQDGAWYCLLSDVPNMHVNMRVTTPVPDRPEITYITGISVLTTDSEGLEHSIVITVKDPHSLESACATAEDGKASPCLADGALNVMLDGQEGLVAPGSATLAPDVVGEAVNLPGACR